MRLLYGNRRPSLCGEECPAAQWCQECGTKTQEIVDLVSFEAYCDIDLDTDPLIVLSCHHAFTMTFLDQQLFMSKFYRTQTKEGLFCDPTCPQDLGFFPKCATCRKEFSTIKRYYRIEKLAFMDRLNETFHKLATSQLQKIEFFLGKLEKKTFILKNLTILNQSLNNISKECLAVKRISFFKLIVYHFFQPFSFFKTSPF